MSGRSYRLFITFIAAVCVYVVIRHLLIPDSLTLRNALVQGFFVGFGLAVVTIEIVASIKTTKQNGWVTAFGCALPSNGMFTRAAHTRTFPGPINVPQEAMYWRTSVDCVGRTLSGRHDYTMHFGPGGLPPNAAFWSLTMGDAKNRFVANPINRYSVSDRSNLAPNADGSIDIYIQNKAPVGHESNWLPAPATGFILWLRVYMPGAAILDGEYRVPPVVQVK